MSRLGIENSTTVVFYGDKTNWWAAYAAWVFHLFGHENVRLMDGGRLKWQQEERALTKETPHFEPSQYVSPVRDDAKHRAFRDEVSIACQFRRKAHRCSIS
jgi:thiosulfate/3-mercaptopyruvate sulfurtransferase